MKRGDIEKCGVTAGCAGCIGCTSILLGRRQAALSTECRAAIEVALVTDGDVKRVEESRTRWRLKRQSLGAPVDVRGESGASSRAGPRAVVPAAVPREVACEQPAKGPSTSGSGVKTPQCRRKRAGSGSGCT